MTPSESAARLRQAVDDMLPLLRTASEPATTWRPVPGKWCAREVIGHLIDSACNNHRRFVLGHAKQVTRWDGYEQEQWVDSQRYAEAAWPDLVTLWVAYNRHLAHVMTATSAEVAAFQALAPDGTGQLSLGFLMKDYVQHLEHHLGQVNALLRR